ncbi:MAG TPA: NAD(P)-dependent oxidoreductase [Candidatus Baltobacteraceae bacterium]|nr:NAD(P)-dependent oxidoreductase [Candidatus Baltobacteraceae bacterium]
MTKRVGFIGLGAMGEPMARSLQRAGFEVTASAHHRRDALERLVAEGAHEAADPAAVAAAVEAVVICVPDAPQVEEVLFGARGVAAGAKSGDIVIDMSTISPVASRRFAERLAEIGVDFVDAPVSGGPARAREGTLTIMTGGSAAAIARVEPLLRAMGNPHHVGPVGMGETVKLVNQIIIANVMIANAEGLLFAKRAGADLDAVRGVLASATASNYLLTEWLPKTWLAGTFEGGFAMDLLRKDLAAALDAARAAKFPMPATGLAYQLYTNRSAEGDGALDYSAIIKTYERIAGTQTAAVGAGQKPGLQ